MIEMAKPSKKQRKQSKLVVAAVKGKIHEKSADSEPLVQQKKHLKWSGKFLDFYDQKYKFLMIGTILLLVLALLQIGIQYGTTGDFLHKGISLKGGIEIIISKTTTASLNDISKTIQSALPNEEVTVNQISGIGSARNIIVELSIPKSLSTNAAVNKSVNAISKYFSGGLVSNDYSVQISGSQFSDAFFVQLLFTILIAFLMMGIVVFAYFRIPIPSLAVVLSAFSDITITLAVVNLMGIRISSAGIGAFLMLIGYSVDTDILLTTRVLKRKNDTLLNRIMGAMKTGMTMSLTTIAAVIVGLIVTNSNTIHQIMLIVLIGLFVDILNTWIQNVGILRMYVERKSE